jgi:hypothetical protein
VQSVSFLSDALDRDNPSGERIRVKFVPMFLSIADVPAGEDSLELANSAWIPLSTFAARD